MTKKYEHFFSGLPFRAAGDKRLAASHFRVMMTIAAHDQFNKNGRGCDASNPRLAALSTSDLKALSRSISELVEWGYLRRKPNPKDRRQSILTIIYNEFDYAYFKAGGGGIGSIPATKVGSKSATEQEGFRPSTPPPASGFGGGIGDVAASILQKVGSKVQKKDEEFQSDASPNIFCEAVINPDESEKKFSEAAKWAHEEVPGGSVGSILGMIERKIKHGGMSLDDVEMWRGHIDLIFEPKLDPDSVESRWARRLSAELDARAKKLVGGHGTA